MITLFGLRNCDGCKKALSWCKENGVEAVIHDFKKDGLSEAQLLHWIDKSGIDKLINKRGTTWRKLTPSQQSMMDDPKSARILIQENTSLIKRPVVELGQDVFVGFDDRLKAALV